MRENRERGCLSQCLSLTLKDIEDGFRPSEEEGAESLNRTFVWLEKQEKETNSKLPRCSS